MAKEHHTMKYDFSPEEVQSIREAFKRRRESEAVIEEARNRVTGKNKTHALRKILGQCPECGGSPVPGMHYCEKCRITMNNRHKTKRERDCFDTEINGVPVHFSSDFPIAPGPYWWCHRKGLPTVLREIFTPCPGVLIDRKSDLQPKDVGGYWSIKLKA